MSGWAVRIDGQGSRSVDGPLPNPDDASKAYPDLNIERYSEEYPPDPIALPPTDAEAVDLARGDRDRLLSVAAIRISPLQDAVDLDEATPAEAAQLKKWKQYRIAVNRVQDQPGYPQNIVWPLEPV